VVARHPRLVEDHPLAPHLLGVGVDELCIDDDLFAGAADLAVGEESDVQLAGKRAPVGRPCSTAAMWIAMPRRLRNATDPAPRSAGG
jgi:hypothetical protein